MRKYILNKIKLLLIQLRNSYNIQKWYKNTKRTKIKYVSATHAGKTHDKKLCDEDGICLPQGSHLYRDSGFQGHHLEGVVIHQPKKKPRGGQLSEQDKVHNRLISQVRIGVEQATSGAKRCHIVKAVFRNTKLGYDDTVMELACGLHNFRSHCRLQAY